MITLTANIYEPIKQAYNVQFSNSELANVNIPLTEPGNIPYHLEETKKQGFRSVKYLYIVKESTCHYRVTVKGIGKANSFKHVIWGHKVFVFNSQIREILQLFGLWRENPRSLISAYVIRF